MVHIEWILFRNYFVNEWPGSYLFRFVFLFVGYLFQIICEFLWTLCSHRQHFMQSPLFIVHAYSWFSTPSKHTSQLRSANRLKQANNSNTRRPWCLSGAFWKTLQTSHHGMPWNRYGYGQRPSHSLEQSRVPWMICGPPFLASKNRSHKRQSAVYAKPLVTAVTGPKKKQLGQKRHTWVFACEAFIRDGFIALSCAP